MNCPDCRDRLQQWLDSRTRETVAVPGEPPALCSACTEWTAAARRFDHGLRLLAPHAPPPHLTNRIVAGIAAVHRSRRRRRLLFSVGIAAAAMLLLALWQGFRTGGPAAKPAPDMGVTVLSPQPAPISPTLGDSVAEAGSAVASLTSRTADETVAKTKILLPVVGDPSLGKLDLPPPLDPPARSLRQTGESVSAGLEPVTDSARRAVGLFLRELTPMDAAPKTGF